MLSALAQACAKVYRDHPIQNEVGFNERYQSYTSAPTTINYFERIYRDPKDAALTDVSFPTECGESIAGFLALLRSSNLNTSSLRVAYAMLRFAFDKKVYGACEPP